VLRSGAGVCGGVGHPTSWITVSLTASFRVRGFVGFFPGSSVIIEANTSVASWLAAVTIARAASSLRGFEGVLSTFAVSRSRLPILVQLGATCASPPLPVSPPAE